MRAKGRTRAQSLFRILLLLLLFDSLYTTYNDDG